MKPKKQQLPKARAVWSYPAQVKWGEAYITTRQTSVTQDQPCAIIPTATIEEAKAIASFFNLSEDKQADALAKAMCPHSWPQNKKYWLLDARAVLRRVKEGK